LYFTTSLTKFLDKINEMEKSSAPNFNLVSRSSLTTYLAISAKKPQIYAVFRRKKFVANAEPAVGFWGRKNFLSQFLCSLKSCYTRS
jgi:hypothetical protein